MMSEEEVAFRNLYTRGEAREGREPEKEERQFKDPKNGKGHRKLGPKWEGGGEQTQWPTGFLLTSNCLSLASKEFPGRKDCPRPISIHLPHSMTPHPCLPLSLHTSPIPH